MQLAVKRFVRLTLSNTWLDERWVAVDVLWQRFRQSGRSVRFPKAVSFGLIAELAQFSFHVLSRAQFPTRSWDSRPTRGVILRVLKSKCAIIKLLPSFQKPMLFDWVWYNCRRIFPWLMNRWTLSMNPQRGDEWKETYAATSYSLQFLTFNGAHEILRI